METIFNWLAANYLELFGTISGLVYIVLSIRQNIWLWPLGMFSSGLQAYIFFNSSLYADMSLQFYYVAISFYGWYFWIYGKKTGEKKLPVKKTSLKLWVNLLLVTIALFIVISYILINFTNSDVPYIDAFTTAASITGTWMLARKYIENWFVWLVVDSISSGLYIYKGLYYLAILYFVLTVMCIKGYSEWKKGIQKI